MRLVFLGTPRFALPCLEALSRCVAHEVAAVVTQPDRPQGRKMQLQPPPVKSYALERGIPVLQPGSLRTHEIQQEIAAFAPDCIVVVAYGKLLPKELLMLPRFGCVNVHASLLPKYRGAAPIQWAILNGETESGITTMQMAEGLDTGDMLLQKSTLIPENMTAGALHDALSVLGAELLLETLTELGQGSLIPRAQDHSAHSYAPPLTRALSPLDVSKPAQQLHNQVRGLSPWPGATLERQGTVLKIHRTQVRKHPTDSPLCLQCGDGLWLDVLDLQPEGKRVMTAAEYLRGSGTHLWKGDH